jgi:hypothetical protein
VSLFYEKLEMSFELFVPVFRSPARPMTHPWYTTELLNLENRRTREFKYSSRTGNRELYERLRTEHKHLYNECYASYMDGIENGIKRDPKRFFDFANYKRKTVGYDNSVGDCPADICELCVDFFESVYNADTFDLKAAISGLDANKGPGNDGVPPSFVKLCADGLKSPLLYILIFHFLPALFLPNGRIPCSFLVSRPVNEMMLVSIVVWQYFHALRNSSRSQYMILCLL